MKNLKTMMLTLGLSSVFALGACGSDIDKVEEAVNKACKCKDKECFEKVMEKMEKDIGEKGGEKLMKDEPEKMGKLIGKAMECGMKLEGGMDEAPPAE